MLDLQPIKERLAAATCGPWTWDLSLASKRIVLLGGKPKYDLTVLDFVRWGMNGAAPRFRTGPENMNIMKHGEKFGAIRKDREHHADWSQWVNHPDALLMENAPTDIAALIAEVERLRGICGELRDGLEELKNHPAIKPDDWGTASHP